MHFRVHLAKLVLAGCVLALPAAKAEVPAVTGITVGSSEQQTEAKLGPSFKWVTMMSWNGSNMNVRYGSSAQNDESYVLQSVNEKIFFVSHGVRFKKGAAPQLQEFFGQLEAKYGNVLTSEQSGLQPSGFHHWLYDSSGRNIAARPPYNCPIRAGGSSGDSTPNVPRGTHSLGVSVAPPTPCPIFVEAFVSRNEDTHELVGSYNVDLGDQGPMLAEFQRLDRIAAAEHDKQVNGAKGVKPPL